MKSTEEEACLRLSQNKNAKKGTYACKVCGQKFRFLKALEKHEVRHQGEGGFICRNCGLSFTSADAREKHRDKEHKVLRCRICKVRFHSETEYLQHINTLHDGRDRELCVCSVCGKQFKTKGELTHHVSSQCGTIKKYKCNVCFQTLMTAGSLFNHMLRHKGEHTFMCRFCAKTFLTAGQLTVHERIHTQEKPFVCQVCHKGFSHRQSLITHSTLHTGIKPYQCECCGNAFSCVGNLLKHRKTHADTCGKIPLTTHRVKNPSTKFKVQVNTPPTSKFKTLEKRKRFEDTVKEKGINAQVQNDLEMESNIPNNDIFEDDCIKTLPLLDEQLPFQSDIALKEEEWLPTTHFLINNDQITTSEVLFNNMTANEVKEERNTNEDEDIVDNDNDWMYNNSNNDSSDDSVDLYTRKMKTRCKGVERNGKMKKVKRKRTSKEDRLKLQKFIGNYGENGMSCKYCGNHYSLFQCLMKHERKHEELMKNGNEQATFKCSCCHKTFRTKEECTSHQQSEHVDQLKCKECVRLFANPDSMKAHIKFHHKGMPRKIYIYVCDKCGKVFKQKALLTSHEENNCDDSPLYACDICHKAFASKHVRKSHMRIHLPEKSLLCKYCGKRFRWKGQLKIHERSHTGERPFVCSVCSKTFAYRESLVTHMTMHTGIKPHLCEMCGSRFSCIGNLLKHRRTRAFTCGAAIGLKAGLIGFS